MFYLWQIESLNFLEEMLQICLKGSKITGSLIIIWLLFFLLPEQEGDPFLFTFTQNRSHIINYPPEGDYPSFFSIISILVFMRAAGVYVVEAVVKKCRVVTFPQGDVLITLRIGRNSTTSTYHQTEPTQVAQINSILQLNVDSSALETQRCSLTLTSAQKKVIGIALVTLPKDRDSVENTYRLTQSEDKRAEIDLKIRIMPVQSASLIKGSQQAKNLQLSKTVQDNLSKDEGNANKIYSGVTKNEKTLVSSINLRSRASEDFNPQVEQKKSKAYKIREENKQITIKQSELKQLKDQRQAYYQLYQIQKSKNEVASKFISSLIRKLQPKFPNIEPIAPISAKKIGQNISNGRNKAQQSQQNSAIIQQLEQANRSLHRQVDQYKKICDQLRGQVTRLSSGKPTPSNESNFSKPKNSFNPWDLYPKKSNILPAELTNQLQVDGQPHHQQEKKPSYSDIDLKKWLEQSVGQRQHFQEMLASLNSKETAATGPDKSTATVRKMKLSIDRAFTSLLGRKDLTRQAILLHKQDINRILDEMIAA